MATCFSSGLGSGKNCYTQQSQGKSCGGGGTQASWTWRTRHQRVRIRHRRAFKEGGVGRKVGILHQGEGGAAWPAEGGEGSGGRQSRPAGWIPSMEHPWLLSWGVWTVFVHLWETSRPFVTRELTGWMGNEQVALCAAWARVGGRAETFHPIWLKIRKSAGSYHCHPNMVW